MLKPLPPSKLPRRMGDVDLHLTDGTLANPSLHPKRRLDQFSRFRMFQDCDRTTERQTNHASPSVTIGRIYIVVRDDLILSWAIILQ